METSLACTLVNARYAVKGARGADVEFDLSNLPSGIASWRQDSLQVDRRSSSDFGQLNFLIDARAGLAMHEARLG
jgi:hypothetical protein